MRDQSMDLQTNTFTSSSQGLRSHRSRTKLPSRQANNDLKLHRQGSQTKLDKRRSGGEHLNEQIEVQKMFRLHARSRINEEQSLFSLKLLGFMCQSGEDYARFHKIWTRYGPLVDEEGFKALVSEAKAKGEMRDHTEPFNVLAQGKMVLDAKRLALMGQELGKDTSEIMEYCGKEGIIDFAQFASIMKFTNALT